MKIRHESFGRTEDLGEVTKFYLENEKGNYAVVTDYGCTILELWVADRSGKRRNVVLGYQSLEEYRSREEFLGACVGRFGGWIKDGRILVGEKAYQLERTDGKNHLHGGKQGFDKRLWESRIEGAQVHFSRLSPDGEEHYPGNLKVQISYEFTEQDELKIHYEAVCDEDTVCNLTNHSYFNLGGEGSGSIYGHELQLHAHMVQENNEDGISDLGMFPVEGTVFDFCRPKPIGRDAHEEEIQLHYGCGYDHNYYLGSSGKLREAAVLSCRESGLKMRVWTDQSGIQLYAGNYLSGYRGRSGALYEKHAGVCLEAQYCPSQEQIREGRLYPLLKAGEKYEYTTIYQFQIGQEE